MQIKSGEIFASINQKDGMVLFKDDPEQYNLPDMFLNVQTNITQVLDLVKQINKMEEEIILNPMVSCSYKTDCIEHYNDYSTLCST